MAEDVKINTDIDGWLNDFEDENCGGEELDQADIDSLLGSNAEAETQQEAGGGEELSGELDQADLDRLIGDCRAEEEETIDQEEMDRLFGSSAAEQGTAENEVDFAEILGGHEDSSPFSDFDVGLFPLEPESWR
ncbi:MAG: hypothetical protein P8130_04845 [Deltaproteobacteria bacterium]